MHQHGALCPRAFRPFAAAGLQHLHLRDLVPGRARAARFRSARQRSARVARTVMPDIAIRFATADDAGLLLRLIRELAAFEKSPDAVVATEADLIRHGFRPNPQFDAILALPDAEPAGRALFHTRVSPRLPRPGPYSGDLSM